MTDSAGVFSPRERSFGYRELVTAGAVQKEAPIADVDIAKVHFGFRMLSILGGPKEALSARLGAKEMYRGLQA